jgi:hypothetical protein
MLGRATHRQLCLFRDLEDDDVVCAGREIVQLERGACEYVRRTRTKRSQRAARFVS